MMFTNGQHNLSLLLISSRAEGTLHLLPGLSGYQVGQVTSTDEVLEFLRTHTPDAILAPAGYASQKLFESIQADMPYPRRPLFVILIGDGETSTSAEVIDAASFADAVLSPELVGSQLTHFLRLKQQSLNLFNQQQAALQAEAQRINELREQLSSAQRIQNQLEVLKNAIVRNVSHELKTPLLQIKSAVALLREEPDEEKKKQLIDLATDSTARLEVLVRNITMLGGSLDTHPGPIILHDAVEAARRNLRRIWEQRDQTHRIRTDIPSTLPPVMADKQGISIVFQLLIDNALKFSPQEVYVEALAVEDNRFVEIRVRDTGIGIAKDQLGRIFEIFYQVDSSSTRPYGGMGVGLAIVRLILENHETQIKVESEPGKGSQFYFRLPVVKF